MERTIAALFLVIYYLDFGVHLDARGLDETTAVDIKYRKEITSDELLHMTLMLNRGDDVISLRLSRVKRNVPSPSLLVVTEAGLVQDLVRNKQLIGENVFYKDETNTSAFSIKWTNGQIKHVNGHFVRDGFIHSITSSERKGFSESTATPLDVLSRTSRAVQGSLGVPTSSGGNETQTASPHYMSKINVPVDLIGDAVEFHEQFMTVKERHRTNRRKRRQLGTSDPENLYVEYVAVTDYQNYKKWKDDLSDGHLSETEKDLTTKMNMLEFYQHVVHGIDVIFKTVANEEIDIDIVLTGLVICNESNICPWTENNKICPDCNTVDDAKCLVEFSDWRKNVLGLLLDHDHAALFTGYDLYYTAIQSAKTVGLAYMSNMCQNGSVSMIEERRNALSIHIAAHELGHSFGSHHDGSQATQACPETEMYLMAPRMSGVTDPAKANNPWMFSPCSRVNIYDYIDMLDQEGMNCMVNVPTIQASNPGTGAGQIYSPDNQCQVQYGERSAVCREYHINAWDGICYSMACRIPGTGECNLIYPHDGTPCGNMKWCQQGACVYSGTAENINELCPLGDDPFYNCTFSDCEDTRALMMGHCCHTCRHKLLVTTKSTTVAMTTRASPDPQSTLSSKKIPSSITYTTPRSNTDLTTENSTKSTANISLSSSRPRSTLSSVTSIQPSSAATAEPDTTTSTKVSFATKPPGHGSTDSHKTTTSSPTNSTRVSSPTQHSGSTLDDHTNESISTVSTVPVSSTLNNDSPFNYSTKPTTALPVTTTISQNSSKPKQSTTNIPINHTIDIVNNSFPSTKFHRTTVKYSPSVPNASSSDDFLSSPNVMTTTSSKDSNITSTAPKLSSTTSPISSNSSVTSEAQQPFTKAPTEPGVSSVSTSSSPNNTSATKSMRTPRSSTTPPTIYPDSSKATSQSISNNTTVRKSVTPSATLITSSVTKSSGTSSDINKKYPTTPVSTNSTTDRSLLNSSYHTSQPNASSLSPSSMKPSDGTVSKVDNSSAVRSVTPSPNNSKIQNATTLLPGDSVKDNNSMSTNRTSDAVTINPRTTVASSTSENVPSSASCYKMSFIQTSAYTAAIHCIIILIFKYYHFLPIFKHI